MARLVNKKISQSVMRYGLITTIVLCVLYLSAGVYFINSRIIPPGTDDEYKALKASSSPLSGIDQASLSEAQTFLQSTTPAPLPSGRINPFAP